MSVTNAGRTILICLLGISGSLLAQDLSLSDPARLTQPEGALGYPSRAADLDVLPGFHHPPKGYGEVPFWWWTGDPLDKDRLRWQIEELHAKGIPGMQVNYAHQDTSGMPTYPAEPELFSAPWWDMWRFVADECGKRGMGIGLSGYTIDWPNGKSLVSRPDLLRCRNPGTGDQSGAQGSRQCRCFCLAGYPVRFHWRAGLPSPGRDDTTRWDRSDLIHQQGTSGLGRSGRRLGGLGIHHRTQARYAQPPCIRSRAGA